MRYVSEFKIVYIFFYITFCATIICARNPVLEKYDVTWNSQSINSSESMPCGGSDIGLNVWVENGDLLFYISRSGTFDENNGFLKLGRVRMTLSPNPLAGEEFEQKLVLNDGYVVIKGENNGVSAVIKIWVDVFQPVINVEVESDNPVSLTAVYESWRFKDHSLKRIESFANSFKWAPLKDLKTLKDSIYFNENNVWFYHKNKSETVFDVTVHQQGMDSVKPEMFNPLKNLIFGGVMYGENLKSDGIVQNKYLDTEFMGWKLKSKVPAAKYHINIALQTKQTEDIELWKKELSILKDSYPENIAEKNKKTQEWWKQYWDRSFVYINSDKTDLTSVAWQTGRNYQLFRYMLGCNAYGSYPTKFNGGLLTYDPRFTDTTRNFTPDFRNWGGGTFTAQNQRLVYFPMIKSGDFDMMKAQFDFYLHMLGNAELRSKVYWNHNGACFTEQLENFGLPNCAEYGWKRPDGYDKGMQYNAWLEYQWDTALEFCFMILEMNRYTDADISKYLPLIESCLVFFDEHYQYLASIRGSKKLDQYGHLILYPGSGCETYKMAYNSTSTIAALQTVINSLLDLPEEMLSAEKREYFSQLLKRIPSISFRNIDGHVTISPAEHWERVNNTEVSQLYPVFPWGIYGVGKPDLDTAINTWKYDPDAIKFRSHVGWKQDNIFAARLGLTDEAFKLTTMKLKDSGRRFPAFWGPGFDWVPDHNWGGSGMIGLQEMLMQTAGEKIYILPAWPKDIDVHFKLHAPYNTTVEVVYKDGDIQKLTITPAERKKDVIIFSGK